MRFRYVDRVLDYVPGKSITGLKNVTRNEPLFYWLPDGSRVLSPAVVTESLAQLGSMLTFVSTDFTRQPVLLADEGTEYPHVAAAGDQIELRLEILDLDDDVILSRSEARVGERLLARSTHGRAYLLPLEDFADPEEVRRRFSTLHRPLEEELHPLPTLGALPAIAGARKFDDLRFLDGIIDHVPYERVEAFKNISLSETYFAEHFPRKPVVPGVLLLTFVGEAAQFIIRSRIDSPARSKALLPTGLQNVRFRKFVEPGDQCHLKLELIDGDPRVDRSNIRLKVVMHANEKRVLQASMSFKVMQA